MDRIISEDWLDDEYVIALPDAAYRVFDLLVKATNRIGIAKSRHGLMRYRCNQMPPDQYSAIISKLEADGKIAEVSGYTVIMNHYKYWDYSVPNTAKGAIYDIISIIDDVIANPQARTAITNLINKILKQQRDKPSITDILGLVNGKLTVRYGLTISSPHIEIEREREREIKKNTPLPPLSVSEPPEVRAVKAEIAAIRKEAVGIKLICNLTNEQIVKLCEKYGIEKVKVMLSVYYNWKMSKQVKRNDYLTMIRTGNWVEDEANKRMAAAPPPTTPRADRPEGWDTWTTEQKREYNLRGAK